MRKICLGATLCLALSSAFAWYTMPPHPNVSTARPVTSPEAVQTHTSTPYTVDATLTERQQASVLVNQLLTRTDLTQADRVRLRELQITLSN